VKPLGCNCSIVSDEETRRAIVIDPGGEFPRIMAVLQKEALTVSAIVHTHTHIDHVGATAELQRHAGAEALIHEADRFLYDLLPIQSAMLGIAQPETCDMRGSLVDGTLVSAGAVEMAVLHTPGHTPGSVSFLVESADGPVLFSGDTLFRRGIGRTDLWGGDGDEIQRSLRDRLLTLREETLVIPGHGPTTSIGEERVDNPFVR
jgi:glyoxylase-like metal-dependent hydrolase (beta-lactamase superfamily II)